MSGLAESASEIAHDIPVVGSIGTPDLEEGVIRILQVPAVECEQDHEQTLIGTGPNERILSPGPRAAFAKRRIVESEASSRLQVRSGAIRHRERWQIIDRWLVIADRREHSRDHDLDGAFGPPAA